MCIPRVYKLGLFYLNEFILFSSRRISLKISNLAILIKKNPVNVLFMNSLYSFYSCIMIDVQRLIVFCYFLHVTQRWLCNVGVRHIIFLWLFTFIADPSRWILFLSDCCYLLGVFLDKSLHSEFNWSSVYCL